MPKFDLLDLVWWTLKRMGTFSIYLNFFPVVEDEAKSV